MIGFNMIGTDGLGNQMFRYAAIRGISAIKNYDFCISENNKLKSCFNMGNTGNTVFKDLPDHYPVYIQKNWTYDLEYINECQDNSILFGWFMTEKNFKHIETEVKKDFTFKPHILDYCKSLRKETSGEVIAIHIRRTDYLKHLDFFGYCSLDYYKRALDEMPKNLPVFIFSDDPLWCAKQSIFSGNGNRFRFVSTEENLSKYQDVVVVPDDTYNLCFMSLCNYFIIANSTYSWWGAWLAENKKRVIAPKFWYSPRTIKYGVKQNRKVISEKSDAVSFSFDSLDDKDVVPDSWEKIKN